MMHVLLCPGLFGFHSIGSFSYFHHVTDGLRRRFEDAGVEAGVHTVATSPTASLRHRAGQLIDQIAGIGRGTDGSIHVIGHSTGGLDARLAASPDANLGKPPLPVDIRRRLRTITTINTPHHGTPLAKFFATGVGAKMQEALWALSLSALSSPRPPPTIMTYVAMAAWFTARIGAEPGWADPMMEASGLDRGTGMYLDTFGEDAPSFGSLGRRRALPAAVLTFFTERMLRRLDDRTRREARAHLREVHADQSAILQLTPESMELFGATLPPAHDVVVHSVASYVPMTNRPRFRSPSWRSSSASMFAMMQRICCSGEQVPLASDTRLEAEADLIDVLGHRPRRRANDGVVPLRSQVYGRLIWAGVADHHDIIGHFDDPDRGHVDWLASASGFGPRQFGEMLDSVARAIVAELPS